MKRTKKIAMAIGLMAALIATVGAAGASASGFVTSAYPASITGAEASASSIGTNFSPLYCKGPILTGVITAPSQAIQVSASNSTCSEFGVTTNMKMNKCGFTLHPGSEGTGAGAVDIGPVGCGPIKIEASGCNISIPAQTGLAASFANEGTTEQSSVRLSFNISGLKYSQQNFCQEKTFTNGTWRGEWILKSSAGPLSVGPTIPDGFYLFGHESAELQPRFETERLPATLKSEFKGLEGSTSPVLTTHDGAMHCSLKLSGAMTGSTNALSVAAEYEHCVLFGFIMEVKMNSCHYVLHVANAGPPYEGTMDLACNPGDAIEISPPPFQAECEVGPHIKIGPQSLGGVTYTNEGAGYGRRVRVNLNLSGITYSECGKTSHDGTYTGQVALTAVQ